MLTKQTVITRRIEVFVNEDDSNQRNAYYQTLRKWQEACRAGANLIASSLYALDQQQALSRILQPDILTKLADRAKDPDGILSTSYQNTAYRLLSAKYKGDVPADILACLAQDVRANYVADKPKLLSGKISLRSYGDSNPFPASATEWLRKIEWVEEKRNYRLRLHNVPLQTNFGRDHSGNRLIIDRAVSGEYTLCQSKLQFKGRKMYWLATVRIPIQSRNLRDDRTVYAELSIDAPLKARFGEEVIDIGDKQAFLHKRLSIRQAIQRLKPALRDAAGGRGRAKKLKAQTRFRDVEKNYVNTQLHTYTIRLINWCIKQNAAKLVLVKSTTKQDKVNEESETDREFVLRSWTYHGLTEKIKYKAAREGITVLIE